MKQNVKRLLSSLLALVMLLGILPTAVFAEGEATEIASLDEITDLTGSYVLTADITVTAPFGSKSAPFNGTLDGAGHTVTAAIESADAYIGIFAALGSAATVKNFRVENSSVRATGGSASATGMIAGYCAGSVENVVVSNSTVYGLESTGGIVGELASGGSVSECAFESGSMNKGSTSDTGYGGIVGTCAGSISRCSCGADIKHTNGRSNYDYMGGIAGKMNYNGSVTDCYYTGSLSDDGNKAYKVGGIVGNNSGKITNCHFAGSIDSTANTKNPISDSSCTNCYYLDTSFTDSAYQGTKKTAEEYLSLAAALGESNWVDGSDGYPVLLWETDKYSSTSIRYTVEHYTQELDGSYVLHSSVSVKAEPGTEVTAAPVDIEGFTFDETNEHNHLAGIASADLALAVYYTRNSYTLTWDVGEGVIDEGVEYSHGEILYGAEITYPTATLTGCSAHWDKQLSTMPAADTTVTATWAPARYNVTWNGNGGRFKIEGSWSTTYEDTIEWSGDYGSTSGAIYNMTFADYYYSANSSYSSTRKLPVPEHETLVFAGWHTAAEGGEEITAATPVTIPESGSFEFFAQWVEGWTLTLELNGGSLSYTTPKVYRIAKGATFGSAATVPTPTRTGYTFEGWFDENGNLLTADTVIDSDITFTAKWTPKTYTISFNANGGEGTMES